MPLATMNVVGHNKVITVDYLCATAEKQLVFLLDNRMHQLNPVSA
jgi:hypothetical protein